MKTFQLFYTQHPKDPAYTDNAELKLKISTTESGHIEESHSFILSPTEAKTLAELLTEKLKEIE